jgi:hypothetical protein
MAVAIISFFLAGEGFAKVTQWRLEFSQSGKRDAAEKACGSRV